MKHTKGEWYIDTRLGLKLPKIRSSVHTEGQGICLMNAGKEAEANAKIIAAAPELLEACKFTYDAIMKFDLTEKEKAAFDILIGAAIKKAIE